MAVSEAFRLHLESITGPFLTKSPAAIKETVRQNMRRALMATAEEARDVAKAAIPLGPGTSGGHLRNDIVASDKSLNGNHWALTAVARSVNRERMPGHRGYATYIESGVRAGSATYKSGIRAGMRSGKVLASDKAAVRGGAGFKGYGAFRKAYSVIRSATKLLRADYTKGLE